MKLKNSKEEKKLKRTRKNKRKEIAMWSLEIKKNKDAKRNQRETRNKIRNEGKETRKRNLKKGWKTKKREIKVKSNFKTRRN